MKQFYLRLLIFSFVLALLRTPVEGHAQNIPAETQKFILFPYPMPAKWRASVGLAVTTMPIEITEELRFRIPAVDVHLLRRLGKNWYLDNHFSLQGLQNMIAIGPRWVHKMGARTSVALGNDVAVWFGFIKTGGIDTKGLGLQNYPNIAFGYRFNKQILLTVRAESIMNLAVRTVAGETEVQSDYRLFSGSAYTIALEQPFYKKKALTLGFRAIYSNYFWQTWTLFEDYDRNLFFPQVLIGLIL